MTASRLRRLGWFFLVACLLVGRASPRPAAAEDRPSWQCLPDETLGLVRVPNLRAVFDALKTRTKLGGLLFDEQRLAGVRELVVGRVENEWQEIVGGLKQLGLEPADLAALADGESGYAGTLFDRESEAPRYVGLAWVRCGAPTAEKLIAALDPLMKNQPSGLRALRRQDFGLAGLSVRHLIVPHVGPRHGTLTVNVGVAAPATPKVGATIEPPKEPKPGDVDETVLAETHLLVARRGDSILAAHAVALLVDEPGKPKADPAVVEEDLKRVFAPFVEAHAGGGEGVVSRWMRTPGLNESLPEGLPIVEAVGDLGTLAASAETSPAWRDVGRFLRTAGLDKLGAIAYRWTLDGTTMRSGLFVSLPQPRVGLATLVDQPAQKPQPADWVASDAVGFQFINLDLAKLYTLATELARKHSPEGDGSVGVIEAQIRGLLQVEPAVLFGSLGKTHSIVTFAPPTVAGGAADAESKTAAKPDAQSMAVVWRISEEPMWRRFLQMAADAAQKPVEVEQGFSGVRYEEGEIDGGWFIGDGYMVLAVGKGVPERTLAMLRSPPKAEQSLLGSGVGRRAAELVPADDVTAYEIANGRSLVQLFHRAMLASLDDESDQDDAAKIRALWPSEKQWEGTFGVSVSIVTATPEGVVYRSAGELPPP